MQSRCKVHSSTRREFLCQSLFAGALCYGGLGGSVASAQQKDAKTGDSVLPGADDKAVLEFERMLQRYAEVVVRVGLNLRSGQRLFIRAPIESVPLVRQISVSAYRTGARYVDVIWGDEQLSLLRFQHGPRDSFREFPDWPVAAMLEYLDQQDAVLWIVGEDPDLLSGQDPQLVASSTRAGMEKFGPVMTRISRNSTNWLVIPASVEGWARKVFPGLPPSQRQTRLWEAIFRMCRLDHDDPVSAWHDHVAALHARCDYLNRKHYAGLRYAAPGTDLAVGLPKGHIWKGGRITSRNGLDFIPNLPTEEVCTLPHKDQVDGTVRTSMPLSYQGMVIEDFSFRFAQGRVVEVKAARGKEVLENLVANVPGASRLGEVALVPHSSPISQLGILFYNTLIDENAASHIALGNAYRFSLQSGETMSSEEFAAAGGNESLEHVDFMVGSGELTVDGILANGSAEPIMRKGEWSFDV